jgi:hypothetical protein
MYPLAILAFLIAAAAAWGAYERYRQGQHLEAAGLGLLLCVAGGVSVLAAFDLYEHPWKFGQRAKLPPHPCETGTCGGPSKNWPKPAAD